jgi:DNA invertase Pin-like site-specific DNA recombinase
MKLGYARTSTLDQVAGFEAQEKALRDDGCDRVFREQVSAAARRPELEAALDYVREGDTLVVTKLDRLARSIQHLMEIVEMLKRKKVSLRILTGGEAMDTSTATGRLMLQVIGAIAEFERSMMLERQRDGIVAAKAAGKFKGRKPTARAQADKVRELAAQGVSKVEIARRLGIHRASVYRALGARDVPKSGTESAFSPTLIEVPPGVTYCPRVECDLKGRRSTPP